MKTQKGVYRTYKEMLDALPRIGRLQVLGYSHKNKTRAYFLKCKCDCGNFINTRFTELNRSTTKSCGCLQKEAVKNTGLQNKKYSININSLIDNNTTAYILGLYGADGFKSKDGIGIGLQVKDIDILEKIKKHFEYTGRITDGKKSSTGIIHQARLFISDMDFRLFFENRGIVKNKTKDYIVPEMYLNNPHYWRGVLDGDGCIFFYNTQPVIFGFSLVGTKHVIDSFKSYCEQYINGKINVNPSGFKKHPGLYQIAFRGKKHLPVLKSIYENLEDKMYLDRKYKKYLEILQHVS